MVNDDAVFVAMVMVALVVALKLVIVGCMGTTKVLYMAVLVMVIIMVLGLIMVLLDYSDTGDDISISGSVPQMKVCLFSLIP